MVKGLLSALLGVLIAWKLQATAIVPSNSVDKAAPLVTQNANGTITIQKKACTGIANGSGIEKGLCIPAQVIAPTFAGRRSERPGA
jgi:cell division protein FtsX